MNEPTRITALTVAGLLVGGAVAGVVLGQVDQPPDLGEPVIMETTPTPTTSTSARPRPKPSPSTPRSTWSDDDRGDDDGDDNSGRGRGGDDDNSGRGGDDDGGGDDD